MSGAKHFVWHLRALGVGYFSIELVMLMNHFTNPAIPHFACVCVGTSARARYCDAVAEAAAATGMRRGQTDKQTNEKTLEHADAHTNEAKYTHACLHTHTHTNTRARTHPRSHPPTRATTTTAQRNQHGRA